MKYKSDDFLYASARVRAMEASDIRGEKLYRLADAKSEEEMYHLLAEYGMYADAESVESAIEERLAFACETAEKSVPDSGFLKVFRYVYDCHNIKTCIKCEIRRRDPGASLIPLGSIPVDKLPALISERKLGTLPVNMGLAVPSAFEEYAKSADPQMIDVIIDRACFADMAQQASLSGSPLIEEAVACRADTANITEAVRIIRSKDPEPGASRFGRTSIKGAGRLSVNFFSDVFGREDAEKYLFSKLGSTDYASIASGAEAEQMSLSELEKLCDARLQSVTSRANMVLSGPEVVYSYMISKEKEAKNLRIIASGKRAGLSPEHIKERLRV